MNIIALLDWVLQTSVIVLVVHFEFHGFNKLYSEQ